MSLPKLGASRNMGPIFLKKKRLRQRTHKLGAWYQDLGTKIYGEPERRSLSVCRWAWGAASPPPGSGGLEAPQEQQGVWGVAAPQQKQFYGMILRGMSCHVMDPGTRFGDQNLMFFVQKNMDFGLHWVHMAR